MTRPDDFRDASQNDNEAFEMVSVMGLIEILDADTMYRKGVTFSRDRQKSMSIAALSTRKRMFFFKI